MLAIVVFNRQHFEHIVHMYRIERDQARYIERSDQLKGLIGNPEMIVIFGDEWWRHKNTGEIKEIEYLVKIHNERRKLK